MIDYKQVIIYSVLFFLSIFSGIWLSRIGKPYNKIIFTIHKLIAFFSVGFVFAFIFELNKNINFKLIIVLSIILLTISLASLFISGVIMSIGKLKHSTLLTIHKISTIICIIAGVLMTYLVFLG